MRTYADYCFTRLLSDLLAAPSVTTRNSACRKLFAPERIVFDSLPLITVRPVAAMKALREMEWFMSGDSKCPPELLDWWRGQLGPDGRYWDGYPTQLRKASGSEDQIADAIETLRDHPYSRRNIITAWHAQDMACMAATNDNPATPTTCHMTMVQFSVTAEGALEMYSYQRSADVLLGLPHNWVQHWSLLVWLAHHTGLRVGRMIWQGGDVHLYDEPSHVECAREITDSEWFLWLSNGLATPVHGTPRLDYSPSTPTDSVQAIADGYRAADFAIVWPDGQRKPEPLSTIRPRLM